MKFYTKPEIEALALEVVDVIETSAKDAKLELETTGKVSAEVKIVNEQIAEMSTDWQW